jgi:hypothetical protein
LLVPCSGKLSEARLDLPQHFYLKVPDQSFDYPKNAIAVFVHPKTLKNRSKSIPVDYLISIANFYATVGWLQLQPLNIFEYIATERLA